MSVDGLHTFLRLNKVSPRDELCLSECYVVLCSGGKKERVMVVVVIEAEFVVRTS